MQEQLTNEEAALLPVKARLLANGLFFPRGEQAMLLRDMADEIERILAASRYSADLCTQALADIKLKDAEIAALKAALQQIAAWDLPESYTLDYGSNGARDFMRNIARAAIAQAVQPEPCYCDRQGIGEPGVTCGDCPRDYVKAQAVQPS